MSSPQQPTGPVPQPSGMALVDRRRLLGGLVVGAGALACPAIVRAAEPWPTAVVRIIVPFAAGGPADIYARFLGQRLQTALWFESIEGGKTRVTLDNAGYRDGAAYDGVYRHFLAGNRWTFEQLRRRAVDGPVDWAKMLAPPKREAKPAAEPATK